jgi:hypothetical protein
MKKSIFLSLSFVLVSTIYAQEFKFIGGANFSKYKSGPYHYAVVSNREWNYKTGFLLGGGIEFSLSKNIFLEIDGLYLHKGSIFVDKSFNIEAKYALKVISFPLLLRIKLLPRSTPYLLGGGEVSLILSHKENGSDIMHFTRKFDYGLVLGGGFEMRIPAFSPFIEGRYYLGLGNIDETESKNRAILLILGFKI